MYFRNGFRFVFLKIILYLGKILCIFISFTKCRLPKRLKCTITCFSYNRIEINNLLEVFVQISKTSVITKSDIGLGYLHKTSNSLFISITNIHKLQSYQTQPGCEPTTYCIRGGQANHSHPYMVLYQHHKINTWCR